MEQLGFALLLICLIAKINTTFGETQKKCPVNFAFAYLDGKYCCKTNQEHVNGGSTSEKASGTCDGKGFSRKSTCCKGNQYEKCSHPEGCYDSRCAKHVANSFTSAGVEADNNGEYLIDDMVLDEFQFNGIEGIGIDNGALSAGIAGDRYRWPNGELPYTISNTLNRDEKNKVEAAISDFNQKLRGCLKITPKRSRDKNYVEVVKEKAGVCQSKIGNRNLGKQKIKLGRGNGCYSKKTITHEFVHAFGLYHEQSRSDRDKYVTINWDKVLARHCRNFVKQETSLTFGVPYDGKSLMHYGPSLSSNDGSDTITSKMENVATRDLGSNTELSKFDILKLKKMYHCDENTDKFRCPTEKNGFRILEGQCYFFEKVNRDYSVTQEYCKTAFGQDVVGKMWEPQSLKINNVVSSEAKNIFGTSTYDGFWIGITKDGQFKYESSRETAVWEMPFYNDDHKNQAAWGCPKCLEWGYCLYYNLGTSKWSTDAYCTGDTYFEPFTVCEIDK